MSDSVLISGISAVSAITVAFITVKYKSQTTKPKAKNRVDEALDTYERLIKGLNDEIIRKDKEIDRLSSELDRRKDGV